MVRFSIAAALALASLALSSSATPMYDVTDVGEKTVILDESNLVSPNELKKLALRVAFVGDLTIGQQRHGERLYEADLEIRNPTGEIATSEFNYSVPNGIIHYVSILNEEGSYAAVCALPYSLGSSKSYFNARVVPRSISKLKIYVGAH